MVGVKILNFHNFALNLPSSLLKNVTLYLIKLEFLLPKTALNQVSSSSVENVENV